MAATMEPPWPAALPYAWEAPESVAASGALSAEQIRRWRSTGALLLNGLLPAALVARAAEQSARRYPHPAPPGYQLPYGQPLTSHIRFPMETAVLGALNDVTVNERLLSAASQLLGSDELRITQSNILPKYGEPDQAAGDQHLHHDYGANQFLVPPLLDPEAVIVIVYYSEARRVEGPTTFVRERSAKEFERSALSDAPGPTGGAAPPRVYPRERAVDFRPGTCLLFRVDTWCSSHPSLRQLIPSACGWPAF
jgi:hypothetical protein